MLYIHTILPKTISEIQVPFYLVQNEMTIKTGNKFSGTIFYCPENPRGFNCFNPEIPGSITGLIKQILLTTNDYVLLFTTDEYPTKLDYCEMANCQGIERVLIVHIGLFQSLIDKDFQLDASIFEQYFQKEEPSYKKRWLLSVDVEEKVEEFPSKKQRIEQPSSAIPLLSVDLEKKVEDFPSTKHVTVQPSSAIPLLSPSEGSRRTSTRPSKFWEANDITKIAWTEEIFPDNENLSVYKIHGISEIKNVPVPPNSKSHMICSYVNGEIYMNQKTMIKKADYKKITELIAKNTGRRVYTLKKMVGYYDIEKMVYYHY